MPGMLRAGGEALAFKKPGTPPSPAAARQPPDCSRSPEPSPIKRENTPLASRTPSRRAGIQLRRAQQQMAVRPQATSDRQRALPVRVPRPLKLTRMGSRRTATEAIATKAMLFMGRDTSSRGASISRSGSRRLRYPVLIDREMGERGVKKRRGNPSTSGVSNEITDNLLGFHLGAF